MFAMPLDYLVASIVRSEFPSDRVGQALHFHFDVRLSDYSEEVNTTQSAALHLLYHTHPMGSYISVFSGVERGRPFTSVKEIKEWKHEVTHDSCWRDINAITQLYFDMAEELNALRVKAGYEAKAPRDFSPFVSFALFSDGLYSWIPVEVNRDPVDSYKRTVKLL